MFSFIKYYFYSKPKMVLLLLEKQKEINRLKKEIKIKEEKRREFCGKLRLLHEYIKDHIDDFYWI